MGNTNRSTVTSANVNGTMSPNSTPPQSSSSRLRKASGPKGPGGTGTSVKRSTRSSSTSSGYLHLHSPPPASTLTKEQKRLVIEMKLRHEEDGWKRRKLRGSVPQTPGSSPTKYPKLRNSTNSRTRMFSPPNSPQNQRDRKRRTIGGIGTGAGAGIGKGKTPSKIMDQSNSSNSMKRSSRALWILNSEAEEFLFGETASEINHKKTRKRRRSSNGTDEEEELNDSDVDEKPPVVKRRRGLGIRPSELGHLLSSTTEFKGSKLRNHSSSVSPGSGTGTSPLSGSSILTNSPEVSPAPARKRKPVNNRRKLSSNRQVGPELQDDDENSRSSTASTSTFSDLAVVTKMLGSPSGPGGLSGSGGMVNGNGNGASCSYYPQPQRSYAAKIQELLSHVEWNFCFESLPTAEPWYRTFKRQFSLSGPGNGPKPPLSSSCYTLGRCWATGTKTNGSLWARSLSFSMPLARVPVPVLPYETKYNNGNRAQVHNGFTLLGLGLSPIVPGGSGPGGSPASGNGKRRLGTSKLARKSPRCHASTQAILSSYIMRSGRRSRSTSSSPISSSSLQKLTSASISSGLVNGNCGSGPSTSGCASVSAPRGTNTNNKKQSSSSTSTSSPSGANGARVGPVPPDESLDSATNYLWTSIQFLSDSYVLGVLAGGSGSSVAPVNLQQPLKLTIPTPKSSPKYQSYQTQSPSQNHYSHTPTLRSPTGPGTSYSTRSKTHVPAPILKGKGTRKIGASSPNFLGNGIGMVNGTSNGSGIKEELVLSGDDEDGELLFV